MEKGKNGKYTRNYALEKKRSYKLHDVIRAIDCTMELTLRMQNFSAPDDRFFFYDFYREL